MVATVTVLYPTKEGSKFDMDYYQAKHMPLVTKRWQPFGLKDFTVTDLRASAQPYSVQAVMHWESLEAFQKASAAHGEEVLGDIVNFSSEKPVLITGEVVQTMAQL